MDKNKTTREEIALLLASLGAPGDNRAEKLETVAKLGLKNPQKIPLETTLETYPEF